MSTVLIVDDDAALVDVLGHALTYAGYNILTAADGKEFEEQTRKQKPDAIILDILLGDQYGPAIYDKLLENGLDRNVPVVFLSSLAQDCALSRPRRGRTYALLSKPCDHHQLVRELRCLVRPKKTADSCRLFRNWHHFISRLKGGMPFHFGSLIL